MPDHQPPDGGDAPHPLARARRILSDRGASVPDAAVRILAREVLRRLSATRRATPDRVAPDAAEVRALALALCGEDPAAPARLVAAAEAAGHDLDMLHEGFLAAAVRELGRMWEDDLVSLSDVVVGCGRVYILLRELRDRFLAHRAERVDAPRALFATVPGELHTLGAVMAADHFRARGWTIDLRVSASQSDIVAAAADHLIVVFAARLPASLMPLARLVVALRVVNPAAHVVIAGPIVTAEPHIAALVDADEAVADLAAVEARLEAAFARLTPPSPRARQ